MVGIIDSLARTESGGNPNAYRVNVDGRDMTGKYQFSRERLKDLGMGQSFTYDQFKNDPALQERIMQDHIADIDAFIDANDLASYEGRTINGVPITRSSMQAMAHLGGNTGMKNFLLTDGGYNPSDELGTSLSDYARTHGGVTGPRVAVGPEGGASSAYRVASAAGAADELLNSPLMALAKNMSDASDSMSDVMADLYAGQDTMHSVFIQQLNKAAGENIVPVSAEEAATPGTTLPNEVAPPGVGTATPLQMPPGMGGPAAAIPNAVSPTPLQFPGAGAPAPQPTVSTNSGVPASVAEGDEGEPQGFVNKVLRQLMPNRESDDIRREKAGDMLAALSMGLGQMSGGSDVNLSPVFDRIQRRQTAAAKLAENQQAQGLAARRLVMDENRLKLDYAKQQRETAKFYAEQDGYSMSEPELAAIQADPILSEFVPGLTSDDPEVRKAAQDDVSQVRVERAKQALKENADTAEGKALDDAYNVWDDPSSTRAERAAALEPLTTDQVGKLSNLPGMKRKYDPDDFEKYLALLERDPQAAQKLLQFTQAGAGQVDPTLLETQESFEAGSKYRQELVSGYNTANSLDLSVDEIIKRSDELAGQDIEKSILDDWKQMAAGVIRGWTGEEQEDFYRIIGVDPDAFERLDGATQRLVLEASRPLVKGQGTITETERAQLARALAGEGLSNEARLAYATELKALNAIDKAALLYYDDNSGLAHKNFKDTQTTILTTLQGSSSGVKNAWALETALDRASKDPAKYPQYVRELYGKSVWDLTQQAAVPVDSLKDARLLLDMGLLPEFMDGAVFNKADNIYYYMDDKTGTFIPVDEESTSQIIPIQK